MGIRENLENTDLPDRLSEFLNKSFAVGLASGIVLSSIIFSGMLYWDSIDHREPVEITVVSCENCSYDKFSSATDRMFEQRFKEYKPVYREVDYRSEKGSNLVKRYDLNYVPGFIYESKISEAENFSIIENTLVEVNGSYVLPDKGIEVAQRLSDGKDLEG